MVDAVIMWVDGNDPTHKIKRDKFSKKPEKNVNSAAKLKWRFLDAGEIKYCIYSIRKFAPWIRNIFLVTDDQCPVWLTENLRKKLGIVIIDHKVIFSEHIECLPTFNNISISSLLFKIPGLAEKYIVFNDDSLIIQYVDEEDFFKHGKTVLRGQYATLKLSFVALLKRFIKKYILRVKGIKLQRIRSAVLSKSAALVGEKRMGFETDHAPHSYRKSIIEDFHKRNPGVLENNVKYKFRNDLQYGNSAVFSLLSIQQDLAVIKDGSDAEMIIPGYGGLKGLKGQRKKFDALKRGNHGKKFLCFQDLAFLKQENPEEFQEVIDWLEETIMR